MNSPLAQDLIPTDVANQPLSLPIISRERFAQLAGVSEGVVQGWISRGYIPTYEIGKYRFVNLTVLNEMALGKDPRL